MELTKIQFEDGQKVSDAYVEINGVKHPVVKAQYQGKTPLSARNLNKLQENIGTAISDLDERVVPYRNVLVDEQALIKECASSKLKALNKLVGKTEQEGEPTPNNPSEVKTVTGNVEVDIDTGNLFDFQKWVDNGVTVNTGTVEIVGNGIKITATSGDTFTTTYGMDTTGSNADKINKYGFKIKSSTTYRITTDVTNNINRSIYAFFYDKDKKYIKYISNASNNKGLATLKFTTPENAEYVCFRFGIFTNGATEIFSNIRFNRGETDLGYVEHQSQVKTISLGDIELCKIGDYADYIYKADGKWFKRSNVIKYNTTDLLNSDWHITANGDNNAFWFDDTSQLKREQKYSNLFKYEDIGFREAPANILCEDTVTTNSFIIFNISPTLVGATIEAWKSFITNNELVIYGIRKTPTDTEILNARLIAQLSALEHIKLYEGITNISITGDSLTPIADIDYWTWFKGEDAKTDVIDYEISNLPEYSGGANSYMLKKTGNIVVLAVDNIWVNSITANTWIDIGTVPEELRPEKTIQGLVVGSRGDTGNVDAYGKMGITADGVIRCKMNSDINLLSAFSFNLTWII